MTASSSSPVELLAKSRLPGREPVTLEAHLLDTERAALALFAPPSRWGRSFPRFFKLGEADSGCFLLNLRLAALFHDLGKANADFLAAVTSRHPVPQTLRHEHLSALILHLPEVSRWLATHPGIDLDIVAAATLSHHFKASDSGDEFRWCQHRGTPRLSLHLDHPQVRAVLRRIAEVAELQGDLPSLPRDPWGAGGPWALAYDRGLCAARTFQRALGRDPRRRALLLAVKAGLIAADAASSGLIREGHPLLAWIEDITSMPSLTAEDIERAVLAPRAEQIQRGTGRAFSLKEFQRCAAEQGPRTLLLAACGTGKTLAAWKWAQAQARERAIGRVIFLYPTRGTATEGFRDYVGWAPEEEAALVSGTSRYELEAMRSNPAESTQGKQYTDEASDRLYALGLWSKRYFSATADQFLSFLEHGYKSTCLLPVLADSALIIDEVHSFDRRMFDTLVGFLKTFDVPVLCMTATLSPSRRQSLEAQGLGVYPTARERPLLEQLRQEEEHPRYRLEAVDGEEQAFAIACEAFASGQRVLWVVNQVARCQSLAERLQVALKKEVLCYHSRFRLEDRRKAHQGTVDAFKQLSASVLAVTTQVCEMSLDLDADVLITEWAPVSALVQRMGRANRHRARGDAFKARLVSYAPRSPAPYTREELGAAEKMLRELGKGDVNQRQLADALEKYAPVERTLGGNARFLEAGYFSMPGSFRDGEEFTHPCVLDTDVLRLRELLAARKSYEGLIVPVPRRSLLSESERPEGLPAYLGVARGTAYTSFLGFRTEEGRT
ncbi:CRISPR-associated helicase Cas3' [Cystobacter ferrugineus]|uniref:CRISPR-associated helicase Cas3 n=1 Tax=Cystobacter ferrugineus TaxID=83449 RepID=A0A1L9AV70_9BACT|nr:CRISPR-associated helicase Cas3' [Cystobacter ferrugineus]OJH33915.1 CRISPR-associated helicase Cas3' [Cystobacter ferrugineus]